MTKSQEHNASSTSSLINVTGGCHCGAVRFSAHVPHDSVVLACNCSICAMTGFQHLIVKHQAFNLVQGEDKLSSYRFNTQQANHLFCAVCGIKSFYQPRSHPNSWSININCIDNYAAEDWTIEPFDGQNWQQAKRGLNHD